MMDDECLYILFCANNKKKSSQARDIGGCYDNLLGGMFAE